MTVAPLMQRVIQIWISAAGNDKHTVTVAPLMKRAMQIWITTAGNDQNGDGGVFDEESHADLD